MKKYKSIPFIQADYQNYKTTTINAQALYELYPRVISIETQVLCNAKCGFCPYPSSERKGQEMSTELFLKILNDLDPIPSSHQFSIALHRINEPLLDKRMEFFHGEVRKRHPQANHAFFSNGTTLREGKFEWIGEYENAGLNISLNSMDERIHSELMGINLKSVTKNLDYLHELVVAEKFKPKVTVVAPHLDNEHSSHFTDSVKERWPCFKIGVRPFFQWMGSTPSGGSYRGVSGLPNNQEFEQVLELPCGQWFDMHILANGYFTKCCIDETGYIGQKELSVKHNNALSIYQRLNEFRFKMPKRSSVLECKDCFHLG